MPVKHARHIASTASLAAWVEEQAARGGCTSASDLMRTALRQMQERDPSKVVQHAQQPAALSATTLKKARVGTPRV